MKTATEVELTPNNLATLHRLVLLEIRDGDPGYARINGLKTLAKRLERAWDKANEARIKRLRDWK